MKVDLSVTKHGTRWFVVGTALTFVEGKKGLHFGEYCSHGFRSRREAEWSMAKQLTWHDEVLAQRAERLVSRHAEAVRLMEARRKARATAPIQLDLFHNMESPQ